ncbi:tyrosine-type recombinase/integrase [Carboxydothermus hydrogenoformans]|uniref:tyrosine-type recombinase/integrase n=1 Tax=Carboxydothermus hydrogenoformans TaxID=129958 RepID=UPI0002E7DEF7|nr:tyrosine-type recombinase/integrase [Carboxydothermus hydrogenoformans]
MNIKNLGPAYNDTGYICIYEDGLSLRPDYVTRVFIKTVIKLGIQARFHDLRHFYATFLLAAGVPAKIISERLGHSDVF